MDEAGDHLDAPEEGGPDMKTFKTILQWIVFLFLIAVGMNICADRSSKNLDGIDLTYEETLIHN